MIYWYIGKAEPKYTRMFFMVCQPNNYSYWSTNIDRSMNDWHKNRSNQSKAKPGKKRRSNLQWIEAQSRINNWFQTWECCVLNFKVQPSSELLCKEHVKSKWMLAWNTCNIMGLLIFSRISSLVISEWSKQKLCYIHSKQKLTLA